MGRSINEEQADVYNESRALILAVANTNLSINKKLLKLENDKIELKLLAAALKAENLRLQKKIAKLEAAQKT